MQPEQTLIAPFVDGMDNASLDRMPQEQIVEQQNRLLRKHVRYAAQHSPFYRERFARAGIDPMQVECVEDVRALAPTSKQDLCETPEAFLAAPHEAIVDVCLTSATTGATPTTLLQTASDLSRIAYNEEAAFRMLDVGPKDTLYVGAALDRCFMAGLAYFLGSIRLGARTVRAGAGSAAQHWEMLLATRPGIFVGVPSLMQRIADYARAEGHDPRTTGLTRLAAIGEPTRDEALRLLPAAQRIEEEWGAPIYSTYASTEIATTFCECSERRGGHLRPELLILEILDEETDRPCEPGEPGEVVVTPLGVTGMPLIRFRTGDIACIMTEDCPCGRNSPRISPVLGRKNQMLKFKGTTLFPSGILAALEGRPEIAGVYIEVHRGPDGGDRVVACVALSSPGATGLDTLGEWIRSRVRVLPEIQLVSPEQCEARIYGSGKRKRMTFFDLR